jgi:hypothetical protein
MEKLIEGRCRQSGRYEGRAGNLEEMDCLSTVLWWSCREHGQTVDHSNSGVFVGRGGEMEPSSFIPTQFILSYMALAHHRLFFFWSGCYLREELTAKSAFSRHLLLALCNVSHSVPCLAIARS